MLAQQQQINNCAIESHFMAISIHQYTELGAHLNKQLPPRQDKDKKEKPAADPTNVKSEPMHSVELLLEMK